MKLDVQGQGGRRIFGRRWTRGMGGLENWTIFMDVICVSSLRVPSVSVTKSAVCPNPQETADLIIFIKEIFNGKCAVLVVNTETYLASCQASKMEFFSKINNDLNMIIIFAKTSIIDVWEGHKCVSVSYNHKYGYN